MLLLIGKMMFNQWIRGPRFSDKSTSHQWLSVPTISIAENSQGLAHCPAAERRAAQHRFEQGEEHQNMGNMSVSPWKMVISPHFNHYFNHEQ